MEPSSDNRETTSVGPGAGRTRRFFGVLGACLAVVLVSGGCTDTAADEDPSGPLTATTPDEAETTPADPSPDEEAAAALEAYLEFRDDAYRRGEIDYERLNELATGSEHLRLQEFVAESIVLPGMEFVGDYGHELGDPVSVPSGFVIVDCEDSSGVERLLDGEDTGPDFDREGNPLPDVVAVEYTVEGADGSWLVAKSNIIHPDGPC